MPFLPSFPSPIRSRPRPFLVAALYVLGGLVWVLVGEWVAVRFLGQGERVTAVQVVKGLLFVFASGGVLHVVLTWWGRHLDTARARLDLVLGQIPGLLWTTDRELRLVHLGGAGVVGLQDRSQVAPGQKVTAMVEGQERRSVVEAGHRQALTGEPADYEIDMGGSYFVVRVEPLRADGRIVGCVSFALDAGGLRLPVPAQGVRDALERSQVLATVGSLILEIGHQLMNPLFAMSSALDALEARVGDDGRTMRHRALLRNQVERVTALVTGLQEYGRVGSPSARPCDLGALLRRLEADWLRRGDQVGVEIVVDAPPKGELEATLDPELFARALRHLVENSCQHTPPGKQVRVTAGRAPYDRSLLRVTVEDEGRGFLPDELEQAMDPLVSRRTDGAGLGLSIADRIVQLHGGRLSLGASPGGGALVTLTLHL